MKIPGQGKLLRIFIGEADKCKGRPLYEEIIHLAKESGLSGATAIKGFEGFGCKSNMHTAKLLRLSENSPIIIEIVDAKEKIDEFMSQLDEIIQEGLVTSEDIDVIMYRAG